MKVIEHKHVIPIIRNTLNALDARLVDYAMQASLKERNCGILS